MNTLKPTAAAAILATLLLTMTTADACSVPVFRYALERWPCSPYEVLLIRRGALRDDDAKLRDWLRECAEGMEARTNIEFLELDVVKDADGEFAKVIARHAQAELPKLVVRYPRQYNLPTDVWSGAVNAPNARMIVDSPVRRQIGLNILKGHAAVWVLLESGDRKKDDPAARLLDEQLGKVKDTLELPELLPEDILDEADAPPDIKIDFSMVRVSRNDPKEKLLVSILLGVEPDLATRDEPMLFVVIGQGLTLPPLIGKGINKQNIRDVAQFVVGACSCVIKDQIPGLDLLMSVNWEALPDGRWVKPQTLPELVSIPEPAQISQQADTTTPDPTDRHAAPHAWSILAVGVITVAALALLALILGTVLVTRRQARED